jgi:hypothetical protein
MVDLFVKILVIVKILGKSRRREEEIQSLEVREASSSHLKSWKDCLGVLFNGNQNFLHS